VPDGGGPDDDSNFKAEDGRLYDIQYVQVSWSITKTFGPGAADLAYVVYAILGPGLNMDRNYFTASNLSANRRGLGLGEAGAMSFEKFPDFVSSVCSDEQKCSNK